MRFSLDSSRFSRVFKQSAWRAHYKGFLMLATPCVPEQQGRLGLVIAKKHQKFANKRNQTKRIVRQIYRSIVTDNLQQVDIVVLSLKEIILLSKDQQGYNCHACMQQLIKKIGAHEKPDH